MTPVPPDPRVALLEKRIDDLESLLRELRTKQIEAQHALDKLTAAPPLVPPPPPRFAHLEKDKVYAVPVDDSAIIGNPTAAVTVVAAVQFPEPFTHKVWPTFVKLRHAYKNDLRFVIRYFVVHPRMMNATIAACAAAYQGRLDEMEDAIWSASQRPVTGGMISNMQELSPTELHDVASGLRLDLKQFDADVAGLCTTNVARDIAMFKKLGQGGVPVFWINGRPVEGAQPEESFRAVIDEEITKAKADRAKGGKAASYYERITAGGATGP